MSAQPGSVQIDAQAWLAEMEFTPPMSNARFTMAAGPAQPKNKNNFFQNHLSKVENSMAKPWSSTTPAAPPGGRIA
jgi:hypothetical protein